MAKSVLITGCSSGIGASLTKSFQKRGFTVFATARNPSSLSTLAQLPNVHTLALDVTSETSVNAAFEQVKVKSGGRLDILINNAGFGHDMPGLDVNIEDGKKMFETNFWGPLRVMQTFSPLVIEAKGTLVNTGSVCGEIYLPYMSMYNTSKAALHMLGETLRLELAPLGVKVITIVTGAIHTSFGTNQVKTILPADSHYHAVEKQIQKKSEPGGGRETMPSDQFAELVTRDVLGGANGKVWRGGSAFLGRVADLLFPTWLVDRIILDGTGLPGMVSSK